MTEEEKKEYVKARRRASYLRNREKALAKAKERYQEKGEEIRKARREYDKQNPERAREIRNKSRNVNAERARAESRRWREANREHHQALNRESYYRSMQRRLFENAKKRASKQGIPFDITIDDIIVPDVCPVFKVPFVWGEGINDYSPSLDKIRPELGYVPGNIKVICNMANRIKSNANSDQVKQVLEYLLEHGV